MNPYVVLGLGIVAFVAVLFIFWVARNTPSFMEEAWSMDSDDMGSEHGKNTQKPVHRHEWKVDDILDALVMALSLSFVGIAALFRYIKNKFSPEEYTPAGLPDNLKYPYGTCFKCGTPYSFNFEDRAGDGFLLVCSCCGLPFVIGEITGVDIPLEPVNDF